MFSLYFFIRLTHRYQREMRQQEEGLLHEGEILTLSPNRIRHHHPKCVNYKSNQPINVSGSGTLSGSDHVPKTVAQNVMHSSSSISEVNRMLGGGASASDHLDAMPASRNTRNGVISIDDDRSNRCVEPMMDNEQLIVVNPCSCVSIAINTEYTIFVSSRRIHCSRMRAF